MKRASAPGYDRFKTIIAIILVAILLLMFLRGCATNAITQAPVEAIASPNATVISPTAPIPTQTSPSATAEPASTPTTVSSTETTTPIATKATAESPVQATPTQAQNAACNTSVPSRLSVGQMARVLQRLNMRTDASIDASLIQTNPTSTQVEIIGGPVCNPVGERAYQWWQIRLPDGKEGWSAESQLNSPSYFLEPLP
jgi:cytoskeletal protein RodZ